MVTITITRRDTLAALGFVCVLFMLFMTGMSFIIGMPMMIFYDNFIHGNNTAIKQTVSYLYNTTAQKEALKETGSLMTIFVPLYFIWGLCSIFFYVGLLLFMICFMKYDDSEVKNDWRNFAIWILKHTSTTKQKEKK